MSLYYFYNLKIKKNEKRNKYDNKEINITDVEYINLKWFRTFSKNIIKNMLYII